MRYLTSNRWVLVSTLALALLAALAVGLSQAQGPGAGDEAQTEGITGLAGIEGTVTADIPVQGRLTDASGLPVPNGTYSMTFRIYDAETEGNLLCEDTDHPTVTNGLFTTLIGYCTEDDIDGREIWLSVQVEGDDEMLPRQQIAPVPYALSLWPGAVIAGDVDGTGVLRGYNGSTADGSKGLRGQAYGKTGVTYGVYGESDSADGYGGFFFNNSPTGSGAGLYAESAGNDSPDLVLGSRGLPDGDGTISSDPDAASSDLGLVSNDNIEFHLDENKDEDGAFRIFKDTDDPILGAYETGLLRLNIDAGYAQSIGVGDRYRDNAIIAWAYVLSNGAVTWEFGVTSVTKAGTGDYIVEIDATTAGAQSFAPMAIAQVEATPDSAEEVRIMSVDHSAPSVFHVYITNGNWDLVDSTFVFMVTGR